MTGNLQHEVAVAAFIEHLFLRRLPDRQTAHDEWSRTEPDVLFSFLALQPHDTTAFGLPELLLRHHQLRQRSFQAGARGLHSAVAAGAMPEHTSGICLLQPSPRVSAEP